MLKSILVHLRGTKGDTPALVAGFQVARLFGAHLECLHVRPNVAQLAARAAAADMAENVLAISDMMDDLQKRSANVAQKALDAFSAFCKKEAIVKAELPPGPGTINAMFRQVIGFEADSLIAQSRHHDLVVVKGGGYEEAGGPIAAELGHVIASAGRGVLLAPSVPARPIRTVVIAWKNTREAASAVTAALPILQMAEKIFLLTVEEDEERASDGEDMVRYLSWHGIASEAHQVNPGTREIYNAVLEMARSVEADLLITGAFGHSRLREFVFGGFTQGLLDDFSIPVLLLH